MSGASDLFGPANLSAFVNLHSGFSHDVIGGFTRSPIDRESMYTFGQSAKKDTATDTIGQFGVKDKTKTTAEDIRKQIAAANAKTKYKILGDTDLMLMGVDKALKGDKMSFDMLKRSRTTMYSQVNTIEADTVLTADEKKVAKALARMPSVDMALRKLAMLKYDQHPDPKTFVHGLAVVATELKTIGDDFIAGKGGVITDPADIAFLEKVQAAQEKLETLIAKEKIPLQVKKIFFSKEYSDSLKKLDALGAAIDIVI